MRNTSERDAALNTECGHSGLYEERLEGGSLTQLGGLAQNKGVGPEFADGGAVEAGVAHRLSEAAVCEDVQHVQSSPQRSDDAAGGTHACKHIRDCVQWKSCKSLK